jgi:hypothetical protein
MSIWSNIDEYKKLSKDQLIELAKLYGRLALTNDGLWFLSVEHLAGTDEAIKMDEGVWGRYGKAEGRLLKKFLSIDAAYTLEELCKIYLLTPIFANLGGRAEIRDGKCYFSVTDCHPQKARVSKGLGEFPCKGVGKAYFEGLLKELNPDIMFQCLVCPPDEHPEDLWCKWEAWFQSK